MLKITIRELTQKIRDEEYMGDVKTISIIHDDTQRLKFAVYFDDLICMSGYETEVNINIEGCTVDDWREFRETLLTLNDVFVFQFYDAELPEAWKISYEKGGITPDRWDRRTVFHPFNEPNEMFCIDQIDYMQLTGEIEQIPKWKSYMIDWYKNQAIVSS